MDQRRYVVASHVKQTLVEGDFVLMDLETGVYLGLDPVASRIWQSLSEHGDLHRTAEEVCQSFAVEYVQALADIEKWVAEMVSKGLIAPSPNGD